MVSPYTHALVKKLTDFNLAVEKHTAKLPNLIPRQIFRLYGMQIIIISLPIDEH